MSSLEQIFEKKKMDVGLIHIACDEEHWQDVLEGLIKSVFS